MCSGPVGRLQKYNSSLTANSNQTGPSCLQLQTQKWSTILGNEGMVFGAAGEDLQDTYIRKQYFAVSNIDHISKKSETYSW